MDICGAALLSTLPRPHQMTPFPPAAPAACELVRPEWAALKAPEGGRQHLRRLQQRAWDQSTKDGCMPFSSERRQAAEDRRGEAP